MIWYFSLTSTGTDTAAIWRELVGCDIVAEPRGVIPPDGSDPNVAAGALTALAAVEWVRAHHPGRLVAFVAQLLQAHQRGSRMTDLQLFGDLAAQAGLDKLVVDADAELAVHANTAAWMELDAPELPCLVRPDGHVLLGRLAPATLAEFAA